MSRGERKRRQYRKYSALRDDLVAVLEKIRHRKTAEGKGGASRYLLLAKKVQSCHESFRGLQCDGHHEWAEPINSCHVRLCPFEMRERAMRSQHRFSSIIDGLKGSKYIVLSEPNSRDLVKGIASLFAAFNRLRKDPYWKALVKGALVVLEVTYNRERGDWHPHLNIVADAPEMPLNSENWHALNAAWRKATRCPEGKTRDSHVQATNKGTARELLKYITKLNDFVGVPEAVEQFLEGTHGRRFIRTYGSLYGIAADVEEGTERGVCPDCGSHEVKLFSSFLRPWQVSIDEGGVMRIDQRARSAIEAARRAHKARSHIRSG